RLQLPDEVPRHGPPELGALRARLLNPILGEGRDPGGDGLADPHGLDGLRDADQEHVLRPAPHTLGSAGDALTHTLETGPDVVHGRTAILHHRLTSDGGAPAPRRPAARTTTITDSPRGARRRASAAAARLALRERGERDQPAAIAATVRVEELRVTGGAQTRVLHARRVDARPPEQRLVGGPEVQHYPPGAPGSGPRF